MITDKIKFGLLGLVYVIVRQVSTVVLLYKTTNQHLAQSFDCIYYDGGNASSFFTQSVGYCVRPENDTRLERNYSSGCLNEGILYNFSQVEQLNVSYIELLSWSSSIDAIDRYQTYLNKRWTEQESEENNFLCNCTKNGTFGRLCEYELITAKESFEQTIEYQFTLKSEHRLGSQLYGNITCYKPSFECDYGLLCLDWRNICDGKQQCVDGSDENNCEQLIFNECEPEVDYRCRNGMCIDQEYFLDGEEGDCLDLSDEQYETPYPYARCAYHPHMICDERMPRGKHQLVCGDGEILPEDAIFRRDKYKVSCESYRDKYYICELDEYQIMWTNKRNGHCLDWGFEDEIVDCSFLLKCTLTNGRHRLCNCSGIECLKLMNFSCPKRILFPPGIILAPFVKPYYLLETHDFHNNKWPDYYEFTKSIKCDGFQALPNNESYIEHTELMVSIKEYLWMPFHSVYCEYSSHNKDGPQYDKHCWNDSYPNRAFHCPRKPFECISIYDVKDAFIDCLLGDDEKTQWYPNCSLIRKHRFQCSQNEPTCLTVWSVGDAWDDCKANKRDEYSIENSIQLSSLVCTPQGLDNCRWFRKYIEQSSITFVENSTHNSSVTVSLGATTPFWNYCNSLWELNYGVDEVTESCKQWKCNPGYYQCQTGQCIPSRWLCNNVWDCTDGSDEEGFQLIENISEHNLKVIANVTEMRNQCRRINSISAFSKECDLTKEYPCLLANVTNALDFKINRPCINLTQVGDGHIDCYGGLDERNILSCSPHFMQGFGFQCENKESVLCIKNGLLCNTRCSNTDEDKLLCFHLLNSSQSCRQQVDPQHATTQDVRCLNGTCIPKAKCNGKIECEEFAEDEFFCNTGPAKSTPFIEYRYDARTTKFSYNIELVSYPHDDNDNDVNRNTTTATIDTKIRQISTRQQQAQEYSREGWICNRGVAVRRHDDTTVDICFCPPSYYGQYCQYFSDRVTIVTNLEDITNTLSSTIKILAVFLANETVIDYHEFHFTAALNDFKKKHKFYLVHRRPHHLSVTSNYKVRFELYQLNENSMIQFLAVWLYPVEFPFLPSNRIARMLRYQGIIQDPYHICIKNNPCKNNGTCYQVTNSNDNRTYWCDCRNNSYGHNCQYIDQSCFTTNSSSSHLSTSQFCSPSSICRPRFLDEKPLCICSMYYHGARCFLQRLCNINDERNPCLNDGKCYVTYEPHRLLRDYVCICPPSYFGEHCEVRSATINITYSHNKSDAVLATVIQLFDIHDSSSLIVKSQSVYKWHLPLFSIINYEQRILPTIGLIKKYYMNHQLTIEYYLLYTLTTMKQHITLMIQFDQSNYCPHTKNALQLSQLNLTYAVVFKYHTLCTANRTLLCFYDDYYFCLCDKNDVAQCFLYDKTGDYCQHCLANGQCIRGNRQSRSDFVCLCPRCHFGHICQHNTQVLSFTLESLWADDLLSSSQSIRILSLSTYIVVTVLLFLFGLINNLLCFITFKRPKPRLNGVGNYLFVNSIMSQLSLLSLFAKIIHVIIGTMNFTHHSLLNTITCKLVSFLLSTCTRICFWLAGFIAIERVYVTFYPKNTWLKQPKIARRIILLILIFTMGSHIHELIYYNNVNDPKSNEHGTWCVTQFSTRMAIYNQTNIVIHHSVPFLINIACTVILITQIARRRSRIDRKKAYLQIFREQTARQKELFIPSLIIIVSALPQFIISFSFACTEMNSAWQRYALTTAYFVSYIPQILTFFLYIQPSTFYKYEFQRTRIGKFFRNHCMKDKTSPLKIVLSGEKEATNK